MAKDKYSNNHTIEVVGGTQTLIVSDNLDVDTDLAVGGDADITGDVGSATLTVTGNATIGGTLGVTGTITGTSVVATGNITITGDLARASADTVYFNLAAAAFVPTVDWSAGFTHTYNSAGDYVRVSGGNALQAAHSLLVPNGCEINALRVRYIPGAASGYDVTVIIYKRNKLTGSSAAVDTLNDTSGSSGTWNVVSSTGIAETVTNNSHTYWVSFSITAPGASTLDLYEVEVECLVTDYS